VGDAARLVRAPALLAAALGVLAGGWIAWGRLATPAPAAWAALAATAFGAAGATLERRREVAAPRGTADFVVFAGMVVGVGSAMLVSGTALLVGLAACAAIALQPALERRGPLRRLDAALVSGLPLLYGALALAKPAAGLVPWALASWIALVRDLAEGSGRGPGTPWLTIVLALGFVPASLLLPAWAGYRGAYFVVAIFAQLAVLAVATRLIVGRTDRPGLLLKAAMAVGLVALVAGRVA